MRGKNNKIEIINNVEYMEIHLVRNGKYVVTENYWEEIIRKVYWRGDFFVVEALDKTVNKERIHIYTSLEVGKIEIRLKEIEG